MWVPTLLLFVMLFWLLTVLASLTKIDTNLFSHKIWLHSALKFKHEFFEKLAKEDAFRYDPNFFKKVAEGKLVINSNEDYILYFAECYADYYNIITPFCGGGGDTCYILTDKNNNFRAIRCSRIDEIKPVNVEFKGKDVLIGLKQDNFGNIYAGIWYIMKIDNNYTFHFLPLVESEVNVFAYGKNIKEFYSRYEVGRKFLKKLTLDNDTYYRGFLNGKILSVEPKKDFIKVYVKRNVEFLKEDSTGVTSTEASLEKETVILKLTPTGWKIKGKREILPYLCVDCEF